MSQSSQSVKKLLSQILAEYRSIIEMHTDLLDHQPKLATRIAFRMETAEFYIKQLDFWNQMGDMDRFERTADRARKSLEDVYLLISEYVDGEE